MHPGMPHDSTSSNPARGKGWLYTHELGLRRHLFLGGCKTWLCVQAYVKANPLATRFTSNNLVTLAFPPCIPLPSPTPATVCPY